MREYLAILQPRLAPEGALMTRERSILWVLVGISAILGIVLFVCEGAQKVPS